MTIGKRKGATAKGAGKTTGENFGGSLSRNDHFYLQQAFGMVFDPGTAFQESMEASGGTVNEYTSPDGSVYRSHTYTTSGTFTCTALGTNIPGGYADKVDVLLVAGGGGGGGGLYHGSGGGAGGYLEGSVYVTGSTNYTITIGGGGNGGNKSESGQPGNTTTFLDPNGGPYTYTANGGAGGVQTPNGQGADGNAGGSGSGASGWSQPGGSGTGGSSNQPASSVGPKGTLTAYANAGGTTTYAGPPNYIAGGGGGAGGAGGNGSGALASPFVWSQGGTGMGGSGKANTFRYGPATPITYAGGGGGAGYNVSNPIGAGGLGGPGGGGDSKGANPTGSTALTVMGEAGTGGGGGGCERDPINGDGWKEYGGHGGSGIAIVRYKIATTDATSAKATGGNISFWENPGSPTGNTCVHTFLYPGTFVAPAPIADLEYVIIAGGGGGGGAADNGYGGGGGGAGQYVTGTTPSFAANPYPVVVGAGGAGGTRNGGQSAEPWQNGSPSSFNSITCGGGGGGGQDSPPYTGLDGVAGSPAGKGSGGGQSGENNAPAGAGTGGPGGYPGGAKPYPPGPGNCNAGSGGGGAGGAGQPASQCADPVVIGAKGGVGVQLPATFRDPVSTVGGPGPGPSNFWVAGGGAGGAFWPGTAGAAAEGAGGGGTDGSPPFGTSSPYAGGGAGGFGNPVLGTLCNGKSGWANTGGGGGGAGTKNPGIGVGGQGGSGIVLIAYSV